MYGSLSAKCDDFKDILKMCLQIWGQVNFKMYLYVMMTSGLIKKLLRVTFFLERSSFVLEKGDLEKLNQIGIICFIIYS